MVEYKIEKRSDYPFDLFVTKGDKDIFHINVLGWFKEYNFYDSETKKLLCNVKGGSELIIFPAVKISLHGNGMEDINISIRNKIFSGTNDCTYLDNNYKIVSKVLKETKVYKNGTLVLEMINTQRNTLYSGNVKLILYELDDFVFLTALLIGFSDDFSWSQ